MNDEGLADARAVNPFRLPRFHPGIGRASPSAGVTRKYYLSLLLHSRLMNLPTDEGPFVIAMRLYWPKPEALDGRWKEPALQRVSH
jgi:hypothetical protein